MDILDPMHHLQIKDKEGNVQNRENVNFVHDLWWHLRMGPLTKCIGKLPFPRAVCEISYDMPGVDVRLVQLNNNSILVCLISNKGFNAVGFQLGGR